MSQSRRLLGVVMDPIDSIKPKKDSTLAMLLAAQRQGWDIVYFRQQDLEVRDGAPQGHGARLKVRDDSERWFEIGIPWSGGLETLDALLMRKDPPFDMEYIYTTYILELAENRGLLGRQQAREPARHQREGLHVLVPAVHAAEPRHALAHGACSSSSRSTARSC